MTTVAGAPVVVGVDGSRRSLDAVETAAAEAALRHRPLRIVHAFGWPALGTPATPGLAGPSLPAFRDQADAIVNEASLLAAKVAPDTPITAQVLDGGPGYVLRDESGQAALLVLGARRLLVERSRTAQLVVGKRGGVARLLLGSVSQHLIHHAACPTAVVRPAPNGASSRGEP